MKILIVNTYDRGGAANSCLRLHQGLLNSSVDSKVIIRHKSKQLSQTILFSAPQEKPLFYKKIKKKVVSILKELKILKENKVSFEAKFLRKRTFGLEMFSFPKSNYDITECKEYRESDIVNLHWVADFLDYSSFFEKNKKPIVWTLHDMNPFTGGEHYLETFLGIDEAGFPIKRNLTNEEIKVADQNLVLKKKAFSKISNLTIIAPSKWLADEARKSELFKNLKIHCIPYGLDTNIYSPRDKQYSRALLGIPEGKKVILFVADSISNSRKGFIFLKKAFEKLLDSNLVLCAIGSKSAELVSIENVIELGPIYDERLMSIAYSAADVFVIPSLMDNLPNTVLESLMCGTPVIGFPIGGIPDMIQHGENGLLTKDISVDSLFESLKLFLNSENNFDSKKIRENALEKYDLKVQAEAYKKLFNSILEN